MEKAIFSWSGGKDSAIALHEAMKSGRYEIVALLTTLSKDYRRTSMHGVREEILDRQAGSIGIGLEKVFISKSSSNEEYESAMRTVLSRYVAEGVSTVIFGDIFLEDLKRYREEKLSLINMRASFPIWKRDTADLAKEFLDLGFRAIVTSVDSNLLDGKFAGAFFDDDFISAIGPAVDPCGENGEFHSFVFDGPIFKKAVEFTKGETVLRDNRFYYCDLVPILY